MEKKYYFRGLGLGIIVTAVIMGIALSGGRKREMTDSEVIARAKELGMTENTRLLEPTDTDENQEETEPAAEKETVKEPVKKDVAVAQPKPEAEEPAKAETPTTDAGDPAKVETPTTDSAENEPQEESSAQNASAQNKKPAADNNEMTKQDEDTGQKALPEEEPAKQAAAAASVTIVSGDGSYTVARKLEEAGVVSSASAFDNFLCQNGYDKRLRTGTFHIPAGANDEQIAKIVTSQP